MHRNTKVALNRSRISNESTQAQIEMFVLPSRAFQIPDAAARNEYRLSIPRTAENTEAQTVHIGAPNNPNHFTEQFQ